MDKLIEDAFTRFDVGERPWKLVKKNWYVANSNGTLYPLKYIWALVVNKEPKSFNTRRARIEFIDRKYSVINTSIFKAGSNTQNNRKYPIKPIKKLTLTETYDRNPAVVIKALERAQGKCEECKTTAPFIRKKDNTPYLEVHHIKQLAHGGEDTIENSVALCPNCHRQMHFGVKNG